MRILGHEQIILYFDRRKKVKQLTDWDRYGEAWAWDVSESGEINPQTAYAGESLIYFREQ